MTTFTAVITARSGSKGLPKKNSLPLYGKPLLAWSALFAQHHPLIKRCILSTDCESLASIGRSFNCEVPFIRSPELSSDRASSSDVILDVIHQCKLTEDEIILLLEPTSPYRLFSDLDSLQELYSSYSKCNKVVSVTQAISSSYQFQYLRDAGRGGLLGSLASSFEGKYLRRQDIDSTFFLDGTFYSSRVSSFISNPSFVDDQTLSIESSYFSAFEIDLINDLLLYEAIFSQVGPPFEV